MGRERVRGRGGGEGERVGRERERGWGERERERERERDFILTHSTSPDTNEHGLHSVSLYIHRSHLLS